MKSQFFPNFFQTTYHPQCPTVQTRWEYLFQFFVSDVGMSFYVMFYHFQYEAPFKGGETMRVKVRSV